MPHFEWSISIGQIASAMTIIAALLGIYFKFLEIHREFNSKMDQLIELTRSTAFERGLRQGIKEQQDKERM